MIEAKEATDGRGCIYIASAKAGKSATVWWYSHGWQLQYQHGQRKMFDEYHQILDYLVDRGW